MSNERMFPVLLSWPRRDRLLALGCPKSVPWSLVAPYEKQALDNHSQSLEHLAGRGGLNPVEMCGIMMGKQWMELHTISTEFAIKYILERLANSPEEPKSSPASPNDEWVDIPGGLQKRVITKEKG